MNDRFRFLAERGPHGAGLRIVPQYDTSRSFGVGRAARRPRPLQTLVWYPARPSKAEPMTVRDYVGLLSSETEFEGEALPLRAREWLEGLGPRAGEPMWAIRDAEPEQGEFPVFIYAPSFSSMSWENADLCEYLATHGFVVISSPSMGAKTRRMTTDLEGLDAQARDISFLIGFAGAQPNADVSKVAVAGFSWGGLANVFAAARDDRIGALVALDGSVRYWPGLVKEAHDVRPAEMAIPIIAFAKTDWTLEEQARYLSPMQLDGPNVLNAWTHGDVVIAHMLGMTHRQFSSLGQRNEHIWVEGSDEDFADRQRPDYGRGDAAEGYAWVARYTLHFLRAYLEEKAESRAFLLRTPGANGVPPRLMDIRTRKAWGLPSSFASFRAEVERRGLDQIASVHAEFTARDAQCALNETVMLDWAETLIDAGQADQSLALLRFALSVVPESPLVLAGLARIEYEIGDKQAASEHYRASLALSPQNPEARRRLWELAADER